MYGLAVIFPELGKGWKSLSRKTEGVHRQRPTRQTKHRCRHVTPLSSDSRPARRRNNVDWWSAGWRIIRDPMSLTPGTKLDGYEVLGPLGAGGMGEVYRGRDSALKREVAIKVLPPFVSQDPDRLHRFQQEAKRRRLSIIPTSSRSTNSGLSEVRPISSPSFSKATPFANSCSAVNWRCAR
jgi:serine/threonine protein kinase